MRTVLLAAAFAALAAPATAAEPIVGAAVVLDGDTLVVGGTTIRLFGVDAPEMKDWPLGQFARAELEEIIDGDGVSCAPMGGTSHGRVVAVCRTATRADIAVDLLTKGRAVVYRAYAMAAPDRMRQYDAAERTARNNRWGIWAGW